MAYPVVLFSGPDRVRWVLVTNRLRRQTGVVGRALRRRPIAGGFSVTLPAARDWRKSPPFPVNAVDAE